MKARLQHSFDGHRARDTFIFLHIFSLQHFNFLLLSDPMFPFSIFISLFSNRSSSRKCGIFQIMPEVGVFSSNFQRRSELTKKFCQLWQKRIVVGCGGWSGWRRPLSPAHRPAHQQRLRRGEGGDLRTHRAWRPSWAASFLEMSKLN